MRVYLKPVLDKQFDEVRPFGLCIRLWRWIPEMKDWQEAVPLLVSARPRLVWTPPLFFDQTDPCCTFSLPHALTTLQNNYELCLDFSGEKFVTFQIQLPSCTFRISVSKICVFWVITTLFWGRIWANKRNPSSNYVTANLLVYWVF